MKIAVYFESDKQAGGGFQQSVNAVKQLMISAQGIASVQVYTSSQSVANDLLYYGISATLFKFSRLKQVLSHLFSLDGFLFFGGRRYRFFDRYFIKEGADLLYFPNPCLHALITDINYFVTVWDLCHRDQLEFPEVRALGQFERREYIFKRSLPKAAMVIAESVTGKKNISHRYLVDEHRIAVCALQTGVSLTTSSHTAIPRPDNLALAVRGDSEPYIFYPAQFWAHKNHSYILDALKILKDEHSVSLQLICCGGDKGNAKYVCDYAKSLGLENQFVNLGFVEDCSLQELYQGATALVMTSYFGPTNIPPIEAMVLGVPVVYGDIEGAREQLSDSALFVDLDNPMSLAEKLLALLYEPGLRDELIHKGYQQVVFATASVDDPVRRALKAYRRKLVTWKRHD